MKTTLVALRPLEPGKPIPIVERDELGALVGAWIGYWSDKRETVALYPDFKNKFVTWRVAANKKVVNDRMVRRENNCSYTPPPKVKATTSLSIPAKENVVQERMDV